jgi:hypothetical protein
MSPAQKRAVADSIVNASSVNASMSIRVVLWLINQVSLICFWID